MRTAEDYLNLVTPWLAKKPTFFATIGAFTGPFADIQAATYAIQPAYDLDTAEGDQLDAIGIWVGLSRFVNIPIEQFFSWGIPNLGWGEADWQGPFDPSTGLVPLNDTDYLFFLKIKIALNYTNGTTQEAQQILADAFDGSGTFVFADDGLDQTYTLCVSGVLPSATILALVGSGTLTVKPFGIAQNIAITTVSGAPVFGWGSNNDFIGGWGIGAWPTPDFNSVL
jgi:hypothetical protein